MMKAPLTLFSLAVAAGVSGQAMAQDSKGEILVLLSSEKCYAAGRWQNRTHRLLPE